MHKPVPLLVLGLVALAFPGGPQRFERVVSFDDARAPMLAVVAFGRTGSLESVAAHRWGSVGGAEARTELRPGLVEWWRSLPSGLEHGLDVGARPPGEGELRIEVAVADSMTPHAVSSDAVELRDDRGVTVASYAHVAAIDADGARVPARLAVEGGRIVLAVADRHARYPLVVDPLLSTHEATVLGTTGSADDHYGWSVSLSGDGTRAIVGAPDDDGPGSPPTSRSGSAHVVVRTGTTWSSETTLMPTDGGTDDVFGEAVALSADGMRALVGAPRDRNAGGIRVGSARVFLRTGSTWAQEATLFATGAAVDDFAGRSVALSADGSVALVGLPGDDTTGVADTGSARVFVRTGTAWSQQATLLAADREMGDQLGASVALAADGSRALVGAARDDDPAGPDAGSAHVFVWSGTAWMEEATLVAATPRTLAQMGCSVALSADASRAAVGALGDGFAVGSSGSVRVFVRSGATWTEETTIYLADAATFDWFGASVALSADGTRLLSGAWGDDDPLDGGSGRLFLRTGTTWAPQATISGPTEAEGDEFGFSVALTADGSRALIGATRADTAAGTDSGAAHVFRVLGTDGSTCSDDSACMSGFCTDGVCCATRCAGGSADCQACSAALTGGADGTCANLSAAVAPTFTCRPASGVCDVAETCTTASTACPPDGFAAAATVCRDRNGGSVCDVAESCTGSSPTCPTDAFALATVVCRPAAPGCDVAENCTGSSSVCPIDAPAASSTICRAEAGPCDSAEVCDGVSFACPGDVFEPMGNVCGTGMGDCALPATCSGSSAACPSTGARPAGTPCRPSTGPCDLADSCDGTSQICEDRVATATTLCGDAPSGVCDAPDHCEGTAAICVPTFLAGVECRSTSGACDPVEVCTGASAECPPDSVHPAGTACRVSTDPLCDPAEVCDGTTTSCPADVTTCGVDAGSVDGAVSGDGGSRDGGPVDASGSLDASTAPAAASGCSCRIGSRGSIAPAAIGLLALAWARRRRR